MSTLVAHRPSIPALAQATRRAIPASHLVIAIGFALAWGFSNTLAQVLGDTTTDVVRTALHYLYAALLPMLLLVVAIGIADVVSHDDPDAVAPYAIAAVGAAILGEVLFRATIPWLDLTRCACSMDRWSPGAATASLLPDSLLICSFFTAGHRYRRRTLRHLAQLRTRELEHAQVTRRMLESRLQAMQACIEPQFLFDTLGDVERLHATDPGAAVRLIDELIVFLRAAMPQLRDSTSTMAKESELARAWLHIRRLRDRQGPQVTIDLDADAQIAAMPPMLVLPLVEYALGESAPAECVCSLTIEARVAPERLRLQVATRGCIRRASTSAEARLAALRERLATLYGDGAALTIAHDDAKTLRLTLDLPHATGDGSPR